MHRPFFAASAVGALVIALAALAVVSIAGTALPRMWPLTTVWCVVPFAWGFWASLTPRTWLPDRLPAWGAMLGFIAGLLAAYVVNMPFRVFAVQLDFSDRLVVVAAMTVVYYFLWMLVRIAYRELTPESPSQTPVADSHLKKVA